VIMPLFLLFASYLIPLRASTEVANSQTRSV
jgi:hypothetical protein